MSKMFRVGFSFWVFIVIFLPAVMANAIPPPKVIAEANLKSDFIAIGEVVGINFNNIPPHFVLKAAHVIKGVGEINSGDHVNILLRTRPSETPGLARCIQGALPVKVEAGSLVIVYMDCSDSYQGFFNPKLEGLSVVTIEHPLLKQD